jgi:RNA polymerase-binding protein
VTIPGPRPPISGARTPECLSSTPSGRDRPPNSGRPIGEFWLNRRAGDGGRPVRVPREGPDVTRRNWPFSGHQPWPSRGEPTDPGREQPAPRQQAAYACAVGHAFVVPFAAGVIPPAEWSCSCGAPAAYTGTGPTCEPITIGRRPAIPVGTATERHYRLLLKRRTPAELEELLAERITEIHGSRPS